MTSAYDLEVRSSARCLSEIAHALESADDARERVDQVLALTRDLVPYRCCALLKMVPDHVPELFAAPAPGSAEARENLLRMMLRLFRVVSEADDVGHATDESLHLSLPVMGLDQVIGVLRVEPPSDVTYDARHLRLLSVVSAQLGAYLTMIRLREEETRRAKELELAHDFQQLLVGVVSHDLRNPLSVITMVAQHLLQTTQDEKQARAIERALRNARKASRIISDLLDVTHARVTGQMSVRKARVDLLPIVQGAVDDARLTGASIELASHVTDASGEWDADRLSQVLANLIHNASQYGARDRPIRVEMNGDADSIELSVHNWGNPIPASAIEGIFDPFKHGSNERRSKGGGLGLGLFIVDQIVRAHGGRVDARSTETDGTTFVVTIPRHAATAQANASPSDAATPPSSSAARSDEPPVVMVVDDDEDIRAGVASLLEQSGYRVVEATNGADALAILRGGCQPKLMLVDLTMPVMDGEELCSICRSDPALSSIPVFILSADTARAFRLARSGASGVLAKPFEWENLLHIVERAFPSQPRGH